MFFFNIIFDVCGLFANFTNGFLKNQSSAFRVDWFFNQ